jgi:hypothetical protein
MANRTAPRLVPIDPAAKLSFPQPSEPEIMVMIVDHLEPIVRSFTNLIRGFFALQYNPLKALP